MFVFTDTKKSRKSVTNIYTDALGNEINIFFEKDVLTKITVTTSDDNKTFGYRIKVSDGKFGGITIKPSKDYISKPLPAKEFLENNQKAYNFGIEISKFLKQTLNGPERSN